MVSKILKKINDYIVKQNWDHLKFIQMLTLAIIANIIFFLSWIFILAYNELIPQSYLENSINQISRGILWGSIAGLISAFIELFPKYVMKEWDLHVVVPYFFMFHLSLSIIVNIGQFFVNGYDDLFKIGFGIGFVIGGLFGILAYIGEIKFEHIKKDKAENPILSENDE